MTTTPASNKLRLSDSVFFRKIGDEVYVRNVTTGEEFLFSGDAAPVLSALRRGASPVSAALRDRSVFVRRLAKLGLLQSSAIQKRSGSEAKTGTATRKGVASLDIGVYCQDVCARLGRLWSAGLELTWRCNARCRHCYLDVPAEQTEVGELSEDQWLSVVDQLARMGCMNVLVTGGEPTLHPAFLAVCKRIVRRGMLCDIYTNGIDISDFLFDALVALPLNSVSISLYSGSDSFHDEITGVTGSFVRSLETLQKLKAAGIHTYAKCPIFHNHLGDFLSARNLGRRYGFMVRPANILVPGHSGVSRNEMMLDSIEYGSSRNLVAR